MTRRPINRLLSAKTQTRLATWNERTLYQTGKCAQVAREMERYNIQVLGSSEVTYLGSVVNKTGGTDEDIAARRKKAQQAFAMLTPVWRSKDLRIVTKISIFNTNVKAVLL